MQYFTLRGDEIELDDIRCISDEDLEHLSNAIINTRSIESILMNYTISDEQFPAISRALQENRSLRKIDISATNLHDKITCFYHVLSRPGALITILAFFDTKLTSKDIQLLGEGLKRNNSLTTLDLTCNDFGAEGCMYLSEALKQHKTIAYLSLAGNSIGLEGTKYITSFLKENTSLTMLDLGLNQLTPESIKHLADALYGNTKLKHLIMYDNAIGAEGCLHLCNILDHCTSLIKLDISLNTISARGFSALGKALRRNNSLLTLLASVNRGGVMMEDIESKAGYEDLCNALEYNTSLTVLDLFRNTNLELCLPFLEKTMQVNRSLLEIKFSGAQWLVPEVSLTSTILHALKRNNQARKQQVNDIIMVLLNMGRQPATLEIFPLEIWLTIFKHFSAPGIPSFELVAQFIFLNANNIVAKLRSGAILKFLVNEEAELQVDTAQPLNEKK
jgi:hypothetical protein